MIKMRITILVVMPFFLLLSACASVTTGQNQSLSVNTEPDSGAMCELSNDKGKWFISSTPGSVTVTRAFGDLNVICKKENKVGVAKVKSLTKGMTVGNLLLGGVVGFAVDAGTGSAYDYPTLITVHLNEVYR